jgi:hypothetical protein
MHIMSFYTQQHCYVSLKTLYPGGIQTRVFLFVKQMRCPLRHAARAKQHRNVIPNIETTVLIFQKKSSRNVLNRRKHHKLKILHQIVEMMASEQE